ATGPTTLRGELGVVAPPPTNAVLSGNRTTLHCRLGVASGSGAVNAHVLPGDRNDASMISAGELMPLPEASHPPTTRMRVCGQVLRNIIADMPLHRLIVDAALDGHARSVGPLN